MQVCDIEQKIVLWCYMATPQFVLQLNQIPLFYLQGDDSVTECVSDAGRVDVFQSYNTIDKVNQRLHDVSIHTPAPPPSPPPF